MYVLSAKLILGPPETRFTIGRSLERTRLGGITSASLGRGFLWEL